MHPIEKEIKNIKRYTRRSDSQQRRTSEGSNNRITYRSTQDTLDNKEDEAKKTDASENNLD
eukprot:7546694-Heterocapsa_arctica.AAC.1